MLIVPRRSPTTINHTIYLYAARLPILNYEPNFVSILWLFLLNISNSNLQIPSCYDRYSFVQYGTTSPDSLVFYSHVVITTHPPSRYFAISVVCPHILYFVCSSSCLFPRRFSSYWLPAHCGHARLHIHTCASKLFFLTFLPQCKTHIHSLPFSTDILSNISLSEPCSAMYNTD